MGGRRRSKKAKKGGINGEARPLVALFNKKERQAGG
jgi:hypothetical protein